MKKIIRNNLKTIIAFIIGIVIAGGTAYAANILFDSADVGFDNSNTSLNSTTVQGAIDELYNIANNKECKSGYMKRNETSTNYTCTLPPLLDIVKQNATKIDNDFYIYTGATPANYVKFNNQTWRILGVYKDKVKLINIENKLTSEQYHTTMPNPGWASSSLKTYLNGTYYNGLTQSAKNMIAQGEWNVGPSDYTSNASTSYASAKETPLATSSLVGTMAAYEYLYAAESSCWTTSGRNYFVNSNSGCYLNDWLYIGGYVWTMNPLLNVSNNALYIVAGYVSNTGRVTYRYDVLPAVYLNQSVLITGGDGTTSDTAYELGL